MDDPTNPAWTQGDGSATDRLWLADWRRRTGTLYAEVRGMAADGPRDRARPLARGPRAAVPRAPAVAGPGRRPREPSRPATSTATRACGSRWSWSRPLPRRPARSPSSCRTAGRTASSFSRLGTVSLPLPDGPRSLSVFWMSGYAGGLFVPFRDATNGTETYGAGRYLLDAAKSFDLGGDPAAGTLVLDFNFAVQPSCAFDPRWACPLAPPENRLDVPIRAGERLA